MTEHTPLPELRLQPLARTVDHWLLSEPINPNVPQEPEIFDLDAPYQRGAVWTDAQRVALVKSIVIGLPVGTILTSQLPSTSPRHYRVVDGKQRILAVRAFVADEVPVPGWWWQPEDLERVNPDGTVGFGDLSSAGQRRFRNRPLPELLFQGEVEFICRNPDGKGWITRRRSPEELVRAEAELFLLINAAGTPQTAEDLARAELVRGR